MISLNNEKIKQTMNQLIEKYNKSIDLINENINNLKHFSEILEINSIVKLDTTYPNDLSLLYYLKYYEELLYVNDYHSFRCPLCKKHNELSFHKTYSRSIVVHINNYEINATINLIVLECHYCKEYNKGNQHYHALIPDIIFPYHSYSSNIIINVLIEKELNKLKIEELILKYQISHQLYYKWLKELKEYMLVTSIILESKNEIIDILKELKIKLEKLQYDIFKQYNHPYFLFKKTCVPLIIRT